MNERILRKGLVVGIIVLFIGMSVVSSTGNIVEDVPDYHNHLESVDISGELLLRGETAYAYCAYDPSGQLNEGFVYFDLEDPGTITNINNISNPGLLSGGTWACNEKFLVCDPIIGYLWKINPINGDVVFIGGGGVGLNGLTIDLTIDPYYIELYGCSSDELYKIDQYSGEQTYIGSFSSGPVNMIGLACNIEGVLYGWDTGTDNLWIIDKETADCELVGSLGIDLNYTTDGHFLFESDVLFLAAYTTKGQLYVCDTETGECTLIGDFQGGAQLTAFVIPFICFNIPPSAPIIIGYENGTLFLYSNDPNDDDVKYFIDWDDGTVTETGWYPSGQIVEISHEFPEPGIYRIRAKAEDIYGFESPWSVLYIIVIGNQPPDTPEIEGPTSGKVGVEYEYNFSLSDPNEDKMHLQVDWGSGTPGKWDGPFPSGSIIKYNYSWRKKGTYTIRAQTIDSNGLLSEWGTLIVTMPRNKATYNSLVLRFLEQFPNAFQILQKLLGL